VEGLREKDYEVHVFEKPGRRIVAIKFPYLDHGKTLYDAYDSELEKMGLFCMRTLTPRDVEALKEEYAK
jgi:hypothetical protein